MLKKCENKEKGTEFYFQSPTHCILVHTFKGIRKPASQRKVDNLPIMQGFTAILPTINLANLSEYKDKYIQKAELEKVLGRDVVSFRDADEVVDKIFNEIMSGASSDGTITFTVTDLKCAIYEKKKELCMAKKNVKSETPFNDWMYDYFVQALPDEYIVVSRIENIKNLGKVILPEEINEYTCSKSDLVIRKDKLVPSDIIKCCVVSIIEDIPVVDVISGLVEEIKIDDDADYPESECFRNMSAVGASMAMEVLTQGILINQATMYGIVIELDKLNETRLLKLTCDFPMGTSTFLKSRKVLPLDIILNCVLSIL